MRFLGFLFLLVLIVGAIGYSRGWFSVSTAEAGGRSEITLGVDKDKVRDDTHALAAQLGELSEKAAAAVKAMGRKVGDEQSELDATVVGVDAAARKISTAVEGQTIDWHVPETVPVVSDGKPTGFDALRPDVRVKLVFKHFGEERRLQRVEIRP